MTEGECLSQLQAGLPKDGKASLEIIALADEAVRAFPKSARLWAMRGDLIQLSAESRPQTLVEALRSYERAVELAPALRSLETRRELSELMERLRD